MSKAEAGREEVQSPYAARPWLGRYDYWVRPHMNYPRRPLHEILRLAAAEVPDRPATAGIVVKGLLGSFHRLPPIP